MRTLFQIILFSLLWDTFRATHPLYNLIFRKKTAQFLNTFKNQLKNGGQLPIWELAGNYTGCMIGYHSVSVITDAYFKGIPFSNYPELYEGMISIANRSKLGIPAYKRFGYIPSHTESESVSKTLEYAYNDWCISKMAMAFSDTLNYLDSLIEGLNFIKMFLIIKQVLCSQNTMELESKFFPFRSQF